VVAGRCLVKGMAEVGAKFWVLEWLEDSNITSLPEADLLLKKPKTFENLRRRAEAAAAGGAKSEPPGQLILAGTGIDFIGGHSVCPSPSCMRQQVDELFKRVWHYFDRIVVADAFTPTLLGDPHISAEDARNVLLTHLPPLLYLREIGAEHLVQFVPKMPCPDRWRRHAREEGLGWVFKRQRSFKSALLKNATFSFHDNSSGEGGYWMSSPDMSTSVGIPVSRHPGSTGELQRRLVDLVFDENLSELTFDVASAHQLKLPLGAISRIHARMLSANHPPAGADVAFHLSLPILDGVPVKELVRLREREHDSFLRFRDSLRAAIKERAALAGSASARSVADQIQMDVIEPSLNKIRQQLAASEKALAKKTGVSLFLGALVTTCGILCGLSPTLAVPAGITAVATGTNSAAQKHIGEKQDISMHSMYFLWQASEHTHG
jgi:hypothetical protein